MTSIILTFRLFLLSFFFFFLLKLFFSIQRKSLMTLRSGQTIANVFLKCHKHFEEKKETLE